FTIGQRRGLGVGGGDEPLYVTRIDAIRNRVYIGPEEELYASGAVLGEVSLLIEPAALASFDLDVKIRYKHSAAAGRATIDADGRARVRFAEPQKAITPGQSAVFFAGDRLLGGGVIDEAIPLVSAATPSVEGA
ncbi:MAG: tRNA 2-thiouridine(34) synthase MnmA, partial [Gemmatimonadetes bacterium]|nr:tRNA 2-thiouridine(34) synthase MnmA [Gemmatimonadota bacterium]